MRPCLRSNGSEEDKRYYGDPSPCPSAQRRERGGTPCVCRGTGDSGRRRRRRGADWAVGRRRRIGSATPSRRGREVAEYLGAKRANGGRPRYAWSVEPARIGGGVFLEPCGHTR